MALKLDNAYSVNFGSHMVAKIESYRSRKKNIIRVSKLIES